MKVKRAVIPAAGFGTRFLPATKSVSKLMFPIIDKPIIHYAVEEMVESGIKDITFIIGQGGEAIRDYFSYSPKLEKKLESAGKTKILKEVRKISEMANISYVEQKKPLGLGHAILLGREKVGESPFAVHLPDDIIYNKVPCTKQLIDVFEKTGRSVVAAKETPWDKVSSYGIIDTDSKEKEFEIKRVVEKPDRADAPSNLYIVGRYVFTPQIFKYLEKTKPGKGGEIQLTDAIDRLIKEEGVMGLRFEGEHHDTGEKAGFLKAKISYALRDREIASEVRDFLENID